MKSRLTLQRPIAVLHLLRSVAPGHTFQGEVQPIAFDHQAWNQASSERSRCQSGERGHARTRDSGFRTGVRPRCRLGDGAPGEIIGRHNIARPCLQELAFRLGVVAARHDDQIGAERPGGETDEHILRVTRGAGHDGMGTLDPGGKQNVVVVRAAPDYGLTAVFDIGGGFRIRARSPRMAGIARAQEVRHRCRPGSPVATDDVVIMERLDRPDHSPPPKVPNPGAIQQ